MSHYVVGIAWAAIGLFWWDILSVWPVHGITSFVVLLFVMVLF